MNYANEIMGAFLLFDMTSIEDGAPRKVNLENERLIQLCKERV